MIREEFQEAINLATLLEQTLGQHESPRLTPTELRAIDLLPKVVRELEKALADLREVKALIDQLPKFKS